MKFLTRRSAARRSSTSGKFVVVKRVDKRSKQTSVVKNTPACKILIKRRSRILADIGSVLEFYPADKLSLRDVRPFDDDKDALRSDWHRIGSDMWRALGKAIKASDECEAN